MDDKDLKKLCEAVQFISVVFENSEDILIPIYRVLELSYGEPVLLTNEIFNGDRYYETDNLFLKLSYEAESDLEYNCEDYDSPLGMYKGNLLSNSVIDRPNILGRFFNHHDIVGIWFLDKHECLLKVIYVPWGDHEYINTCMNIEADNGIIGITIEK